MDIATTIKNLKSNLRRVISVDATSEKLPVQVVHW